MKSSQENQQKNNKQHQNNAVDEIVDGIIFDAKNHANDGDCVSVENCANARDYASDEICKDSQNCVHDKNCADAKNNDCIENRERKKINDVEKFHVSKKNDEKNFADEKNHAHEKIRDDEKIHHKRKRHVTQIFREKMRASDADKDASELKKKLAAAKRLVWAMGFFMGLGIYLSMVAAFFVYVGMKFDEHFGTHPYGVVAGIFLGFPIAVYGIYYDYKSCGE